MASVAKAGSLDAAAPAPAAVVLAAGERQCSCVGIRSCALCCDPALREVHGLHPARSPAAAAPRALLSFESGSAVAHFADGRAVRAEDLPVPLLGFQLLPDLLEDEAAEAAVLREMEAWPWQPSQSGRWKQDFGPRANFKKRLVKLPEDWRGFPRFGRQLLEAAVGRCEALEDFQAVECLSLKYETARGANHDFHIDDTWLWGERILGVSLQSPTLFTFYEPSSQLAVQVHLPRRSAYLLSGSARFQWQHGILAEDIEGTRVAVTFRELTPELAETEVGRRALERSRGVAAEPMQERGSGGGAGRGGEDVAGLLSGREEAPPPEVSGIS